ncbi:proepiregulin [Emydura macquarii macquarii]|uniref:proepiregulin n=1 Tax=Emydura macquarii macquarii TaxID=1129001 RepID=UPI003529F909
MDAPCSPRTRTRSARLVCFGFYLLQAVFGTTVIPLCEPNEIENCTTALIQTENNPRVAQVRMTRCKPEMQDYCFHGQCMYLVDLDEHHCRCEAGFSGVRCVHSDFLTQHLSKEYLALTILIPFFLIAILIAAFYLYKWYQNKKKRQVNNREYMEVDVHEKNSALPHM